MKNRMRRGIALLSGIVMAVTCWLAASTQTNASGYIVSGLKNIGTVNSDFLGNGVDRSELIYWYMNGTGKISYCLQFGYRLSSGQEFASTGSALASLTENQVRQLKYCLYYGYQAGSYGVCPHGDGYTCQEEWIPYAATQAMVWLIVAGKYDDPGAVASWGQIVADSTGYSDRVWAEYEALYAEMEAAMDRKAPSFSDTDVTSAPTYTMEWDSLQSAYTVTLTDEEGVLSLYSLTLPASVSAVRQGEQVTLSTTQELDREQVQLSAKTGSAANREVSSLVFLQPTDASKQNQVQYESVSYDPINSYFYLKTGEKVGTCLVHKLDTDTGSFVGGAVYGIYSDTACTKLVTTVTTDSSGDVESDELPAAMYYVREITAPAGYQLDREIYPVKVEPGVSVSLEVSDTPTRYRFIKTDDQGRPLAGCEFELFDEAGNVVASWVTDSDGVYELTGKLIEGATYTLSEVDCPIGYAKAEDHRFTVIPDENWVEITTENERIQATVKINKNNADGNWADGTAFLLLTTKEISGAESYQYRGNTYFALQTDTVSGGEVSFGGLDASGGDEYLLVETKCVSGMQLLAEPIRLGTLPVAATNGVSAEYAGRQQTKGGVTYLYDLTYHVVNSSNMVLPLTGEVNTAVVSIPMWCVAMALISAATENQRKNRRKKG